jgi:hypothetical protein
MDRQLDKSALIAGYIGYSGIKIGIFLDKLQDTHGF